MSLASLLDHASDRLEQAGESVLCSELRDAAQAARVRVPTAADLDSKAVLLLMPVERESLQALAPDDRTLYLAGFKEACSIIARKIQDGAAAPDGSGS